MKLLLEYGANAEAQSALGNNALSWAVLRGDTEIVELLLERGAKYPTPLDAPPTI